MSLVPSLREQDSLLEAGELIPFVKGNHILYAGHISEQVLMLLQGKLEVSLPAIPLPPIAVMT